MLDTDTPAPEADNPEVAETPAVVEAVVEEKVIVPDWRDDWRDKLAGGDEKERKQLERMKSPVDVWVAYREAQKKISSGALKAKLPDAATPEQLAAYRADNGIPDKPDGYLEKLPSGLVIGDDDKPMLQSFLADVHGENAPPAVVAKALDWYYRQQEETIAAQAEADKTYGQTAQDELRAEWGNEYRGNVNSIKAFLGTAPATPDGTPLKDLMLGARLSDGSLMGDNPTALKWLASLASEANPAGFIQPGDGASQIEGVETEISKIETMMRTDRPAYNRNEKIQERYRQLLDARAKLAPGKA